VTWRRTHRCPISIFIAACGLRATLSPAAQLIFRAAGLLYHTTTKECVYMAGQGGSMNKANQRQSHKDERYYANQFFVTERNKKRKVAKEKAKHERHLKRVAMAQ
jgi:hypothetical protein